MFRTLCAHMEWADAETWGAVRSMSAAQRDDRLRWLFHHLHLVQVIYLQAWRRDPFELTDLKAYDDLGSIELWARPYYRKLAAFAAAISDNALREPAQFPVEWSAMIAERFPSPPSITLAETGWQVFSHSTYHRGQIATRIRELGGEPPATDYIYWAWSDRPQPQWDAIST